MLFLFQLIYVFFCFGQDDSIWNKQVDLLIEKIGAIYHLDKREVVFHVLRDSLGDYVLEHTHAAAAADFLNQYKSEQIPVKIRVKPLPDKSLADSTYGLVTVSVGNLRAQPKHSAEMVSQALLGHQVTLLKRKGGYFLIRTSDGYISWLDESALSRKNKQAIDQWNEGKRLIFVDDYGHVFSEPNDDAMRVSDLVMGDILKVTKTGDKFSQVLFPDGRTGYVANKQMKDYDLWKRNIQRDSIGLLRVAQKMIGIPYLWGGTSIKGVDCSGFTKTVYFMNGLIIPRDASQQVLVGTPVDILTQDTLDVQKAMRNLQAGDLLFFAAGRERGPQARITHVALYMGGGQFIQSAGKVRINSMVPGTAAYDDFQSRTLVAARRYLGHVNHQGIKQVE